MGRRLRGLAVYATIALTAGTVHVIWQTPRVSFWIVPVAALGLLIEFLIAYDGRSKLFRALQIPLIGGIGGILAVLSWAELPFVLAVLFGSTALSKLCFLYWREGRDGGRVATAPE
ncbi:hypothetical protein ACLI4Z_02420 [Natrialbaceae archaeon A-arb3/5]